MPIRETLPKVVDKLEEYGLKKRIRVITSGKRVTPGEVAWALCAGADCVNSARGFMFALGCIQALQCNKNTCPTGVTTHDKKLQGGLDPASKSVRVANYAKNMMKEVAIIAHSCGVPEPSKLRRHHVRVVSANGISLGLNELHPDVPTREEIPVGAASPPRKSSCLKLIAARTPFLRKPGNGFTELCSRAFVC